MIGYWHVLYPSLRNHVILFVISGYVILQAIAGEIDFAAVVTSVIDFAKMNAVHVILEDVLALA